MADIYPINVPVILQLSVTADNEDVALALVKRCFEHSDPIGGMPLINLILKRGENARANLIDAVPTGLPTLAMQGEKLQ